MTKTIEGTELKPCKQLYAKLIQSGERIALQTHCNHPIFTLGCMDGKGNCPDYKLAAKISKLIREVGKQIARRN